MLVLVLGFRVWVRVKVKSRLGLGLGARDGARARLVFGAFIVYDL